MARKKNDQQKDHQQHVPQETDRTGDLQVDAPLPNLPIEILELIATNLDDHALKSMRATCRDLYNGSTDGFAERYTSSNVEIMTTYGRTAMRRLAITLRSPKLVKAQAAMAQLLVLHDPLYADERHPGATLVSNTITSNPNPFTLLQVKNYRQWHEYALAPLIFERVADLPPQTTNLRRLTIEGADLDGDALIHIFETHKHSLRDVTLRKVVLTKLIGCVQALCRTETRRLEADKLGTYHSPGFCLPFARSHRAFPEFMITMRNWELRSGPGTSSFIWERKQETE